MHDRLEALDDTAINGRGPLNGRDGAEAIVENRTRTGEHKMSKPFFQHAIRGEIVSQGSRRLYDWTESLAKKCENMARHAPLWFSLMTVAVLLAFAFASLTPSFQTNDDPQLMMIAAGKGACLAPDEHLVFTNVVIGQILRSLYIACPAISWYAAYLYLVQYLAQVAILYCSIASGYTRLRLGLYLLFFATVGTFLFNNLQFTTTASLAAQSGALMCLLALRKMMTVPACRVRWLLGGGVSLLVLASLIRLECFYVTSLLALPAATCLVGWPCRRAVLLPAIGTVSVCLAIVLGFAAYNDAYYERDPDWSRFLRYNKLRVKFNDYGWTSYSPRTAHVFKQIGWSQNDHEMIANWFYDDPELYSEARLQHVIAGFPWRGQQLTPKYWWSCVSTILRDRSLRPAMLLLPLFVYGMAPSRRNATVFMASAAGAAFLLGGIAAFNKLPPNRVYFPALTFPLALALLLARDQIILPRRRWAALTLRCLVRPGCWHRPAARSLFRPILVRTLVILAIIGFVSGTSQHYRRSHRMRIARHDLLQSLAALKSRDDQLYVVLAPGFPYEAISPFDNLNSFSNLHQLVMGWPQRTPIFAAIKQKFGISDVSRALHERPDVFFIGYPKFHAVLQKYVEEHQHVRVRFEVHYAGGHYYDVAGQFVPYGTAETAGRPSALRR